MTDDILHHSLSPVSQDWRGYVYVFSNKSMPGLLKIGFSNRGGTARAIELYSQATGIPTPFALEFEAMFADCKRGERFVHNKLADHRLSNSREFFRCSVRVAIMAVCEAVVDGLSRPSKAAQPTVEHEVIGCSEDDSGNQEYAFVYWLADCCTRGFSYREKTSTLFESWCRYAESENVQPGSTKQFAERMRREGFKQFATQSKGADGKPLGRVWAGLRIGNAKYDFGEAQSVARSAA